MSKPKGKSKPTIVNPDPVGSHKSKLMDKIKAHKQGLRDSMSKHKSQGIKEKKPKRKDENKINVPTSKSEAMSMVPDIVKTAMNYSGMSGTVNRVLDDRMLSNATNEMAGESIRVLWDYVEDLLGRVQDIEPVVNNITEAAAKEDEPVRRGPAEEDTGLNAFYFSAEKQTDTTVRISNIRFRHGLLTLKWVSIVGAVDDYKDVTIPTTDGVYWVHLQILYNTSFAYTLEAGTVNVHPDQADAGASRAWREEVCKVTVASNIISTVEQIWPGHVMSVEGRITGSGA